MKLVNYTRIENAYEVRKKIFVFYYVAVICTITKQKEQIRACVSHMINPPELPIYDEARNEANMASTGVRLY